MGTVHEIFSSGAYDIPPAKKDGFLDWTGRKFCLASRRACCVKQGKCQNLLDTEIANAQCKADLAVKAFEACEARTIELLIKPAKAEEQEEKEEKKEDGE